MAKQKLAAEEPQEPGKEKTKDRGPSVELCMTLSHALDVRLTTQARLQRMGRSALAEKLMDQALRRYATDKTVRSLFEDPEDETEAAA
jgi:hypothetical protein